MVSDIDRKKIDRHIKVLCELEDGRQFYMTLGQLEQFMNVCLKAIRNLKK